MLNISTALLCEDIRREVGNKHSLIGVYKEQIVAKKDKIKLRIAIYLEIEHVPTGDLTLHLQFDVPGKSRTMKVRIEGEAEEDYMVIVSPTITVQIEEPGAITLSQIEGDKHQEIIRRTVVFPNPESAAQEEEEEGDL